MTPWLSEWIMKWVLRKPRETAKVRPSSIATNSAHPIVRPLDFQFSLSFQASQVLSKMTSIPQLVDASTQKEIGDGGGGLDRVEPANGDESCSRHQSMSLMTEGLGVLRT